jgi:hypothetical protein
MMEIKNTKSPMNNKTAKDTARSLFKNYKGAVFGEKAANPLPAFGHPLPAKHGEGFIVKSWL